MGEKESVAAAYDRIISALKTEWGFTDDDRAVIEAEYEKNKMLNRL